MRKGILFTSALIFCFSILSAQPRSNNRNYQKSGQNFQDRPFMTLNLTEEQKEKIKDAHFQHAKNTLEINTKMQVLAAEYRGLMTGDNQNLNEIDKNIDARQLLRTEQMKMNSRHKLEIRDLLTEEQKIMFDTRQSRRKQQSMRRRTGVQRQRPGIEKPFGSRENI